MRIKELTYSTLTSPQKTQTNETQYVEASYVSHRNLLVGGWKVEIFPSCFCTSELLDNFSKILIFSSFILYR